ncbi:MAG: exodeoxyribonuclease VII small subunit [Planctomycetes bacterium]|nr:exodeoxyribonuclease VII small subunit [Planctomycetota bacterium]
MAKRSDPPFEELYHRLEEAVEKLERGGLPLEESISLFEEGMALAKRCQTVLDGAEQRITKLRESFDQPPTPDAATVAEEEPREEALPLEDE